MGRAQLCNSSPLLCHMRLPAKSVCGRISLKGSNCFSHMSVTLEGVTGRLGSAENVNQSTYR